MNWYINKGIIRETKEKLKKLTGLEDFTFLIKKNLLQLRVPYVDECCPSTEYTSTVRFNKGIQKLEVLEDACEHVYVPFTPITDYEVRYNKFTAQLEYWDPIAKIYKGGVNSTGEAGMSAYEIAVSNGFVGTEQEWLDSLEGSQGPIGPPGQTGATGATGAPGIGIASGGIDNQILMKVGSGGFITGWTFLKTINQESLLGPGNIDLVESIVAGTPNVTIDNTDPTNPIISVTQGITTVSWGDIQGDITDQIDLSDLLNTYVKTNDLSNVAFSGNYNDLSNKPTIPSGQIPTDWNQTNINAVDYLKNKPTFTTVATSGSYTDLINKPTLGTIASHNVNEFATAAQGAKADTALQVETQTTLNQPILTGNILTISYTGENGTVQTKNIDLSPLVLVDIHIEGATYDAAQNKIILELSDGTEYTIDLSEFSIVSTTDVDGITTLVQEGVTKASISKAGQSGDYNDLLNKPVPSTPYSQIFNDTTDWGAATGGYYTISVPHNIGSTDLIVKIWAVDGTSFVEVGVDQIKQIDNNNLEITILSSPDSRFAGKIVVSHITGSVGPQGPPGGTPEYNDDFDI